MKKRGVSKRKRSRTKKRKARRPTKRVRRVFRGGDIQLVPIAKRQARKDNTLGGNIHTTPLVIYQSWMTENVPPGMKETIDHLLSMNPEFDYELHTDDDCRAFIQATFGDEVVKAFDCLKPGAYKSDLWRYCILYERGGVYLDIKMLTKKKLIEIVKEDDFLLVKDQEDIPDCFWNGFMISAPKMPLFKACIDEIVANVRAKHYGTGTLDITGPCMLGRMMKQYHPSYKAKYQFVEDPQYHYFVKEVATDAVVLEEYPTYRIELQSSQKTAHYGVLYENRDVFSC